MELGNLIFGNSRGQFHIERQVGYEEELYKLFDAIEKNNTYSPYFDNEVFSIRPYYWGECTCGFDDAEWEWCQNNDHDTSCIKHEYNKITKKEIYSKGDFDYWKERYLKPLYKSAGLNTEGDTWWYGCSTICTCDYKDKWSEFISTNGHTKDCELVKPNFLFKPTGFEIQWYKYPLRDAYSNQEFTLDEFKSMIDACLNSIKYGLGKTNV